jgi:DNA modification methylase
MIEPFYRDERADITIFCGDAQKIMNELEPVGLVCTDPPYGLDNWKSGGGHSLSPDEVEEIAAWDIVPDKLALASCINISDEAIIWGWGYLAHMLPRCAAPLIWNKGFRGLHCADAELAWTSLTGTARVYDLHPSSSDARGVRQHPTQKPTALMRWCIERSKTDGVVLDPFMGSGTTLRAAKDLGRPAIGIDISEKYCRIAVQRLGQEVFAW